MHGRHRGSGKKNYQNTSRTSNTKPAARRRSAWKSGLRGAGPRPPAQVRHRRLDVRASGASPMLRLGLVSTLLFDRVEVEATPVDDDPILALQE
jgi:hypothetical protein